MKIVIPTIGTRGDVQPYIALALGLQNAGYEVVLASHPVMEPLVLPYGIRFAPMGPPVDIGKESAAIRRRSSNWILGLMRVMQFTVSIVEQSYPDILTLCREADLVVVSHSFAGRVEADKLGLPVVSVTLQPQAIPTYDPLQSLFKRALAALAGAAISPLMVGPYNRLRRKAGVPPVKDIEGMMSARLNLIPASPLVVPPDKRWKPQHKVVGYWFLDEPLEWTPPADLQAFLDEGERPVVVSLGAMSLGGTDTLETAQLVLGAIHETGVRAIVQGWETVIPSLNKPPTVFPAGSLPHSWLLQRASCVVHHGGFGTTAAGLRAGIPSIILPHIIDQYFWGQRVHELGIGPQPIPRKKLSVSNLAEALVRAMKDEEMRARANRVGEHIRAEQGVQNAVRLIREQMPGQVA